MSISPRCPPAAASRSRTPCSVPASPGTARPPISTATTAAASGSRSLTTTRAPPAASLRAIARPIPPPPPVTTAPAPLTIVMSQTLAAIKAKFIGPNGALFHPAPPSFTRRTHVLHPGCTRRGCCQPAGQRGALEPIHDRQAPSGTAAGGGEGEDTRRDHPEGARPVRGRGAGPR